MAIQSHELLEFFKLLGQATYYVQLVENALHSYLTIALHVPNRGALSQDEAEKRRETYRKKTLGELLKILETEGLLGQPQRDRISSLNRQRRWVIHRLTIDSEYRITSSATYRSELFQYLDNLVQEAIRAHREIGESVVALTLERGVSAEAIEQALEREARKFKS